MFKYVKKGQSAAGKGAYHGSHLDIPPQHSSAGVKAARSNHKGTNSLPLSGHHGGNVKAGSFHSHPKKLWGK